MDIVAREVESHLSNVDPKLTPLVMSLQSWTGINKKHVAYLLTKNICKSKAGSSLGLYHLFVCIIAQLCMILAVIFLLFSHTPHQLISVYFQEKSQEEGCSEGSGVEILVNEPYTEGTGSSGKYPHKIFHVASHRPGEFSVKNLFVL